MNKKIVLALFIVTSLFLMGCKDEPKATPTTTGKNQLTDMDKKALETNFKKSEPKGWKP